MRLMPLSFGHSDRMSSEHPGQCTPRTRELPSLFFYVVWDYDVSLKHCQEKSRAGRPAELELREKVSGEARKPEANYGAR